MRANSESMVRINKAIVRGLRDRQRGQGYVGFIVLFAVSLLALSAFVIDAGRLYYAYQELVAQTQAAALAGGSGLSTAPASDSASAALTYAEGIATTYSGNSGNLNNANSTLLTNVAVSFAPHCFTTLINEGILCTASAANYNALSVTETATVPTTFARLLGVSSFSISATATASAKGGYAGPYNIAVILDTTQSMNDTDSDSQCGSSRISCALSGLQVLLNALTPCPGVASCGSLTSTSPTVYGVKGNGTPPYTTTFSQGTLSASNVTTTATNFPIDEVSLFVFPGLTSSTYASYDTDCPAKSLQGNNCGSEPCIVAYNSGPVYQIIPFSSDYRTSDSAGLNTSSNLVKAIGGAPSCSNGVSAPGGEGTYYAGAIDTAQAQLLANARPNTKNVIILVSDGAANAGQTSSQMAGSTTSYPKTGNCKAAVTSAQAAAKAGTTLYTVAYGAEAGTSSCPQDTSPTMTPCETMQEIANSPSTSSPYYVQDDLNFFSDYTSTGSDSTCISASHPASTLSAIFTEIYESLTVARLIPNTMS